MMITANMLHQVIQASKSIGASVKLAVLARVFGIPGAEGLKMAVENIEPGKESTAFTAIRLMLCFFRMAKKISLGAKRLLALDTVIRRTCRHPTVPRDVGSLFMSIPLSMTNESSIATIHLAAIGAMVERLRMDVLLVFPPPRRSFTFERRLPTFPTRRNRPWHLLLVCSKPTFLIDTYRVIEGAQLA